jgi:CRP/FNR family transcriptional regulator
MSPMQLVEKSPGTPLARSCAQCAVRDLCLPAGLGAKDTKLLERVVVRNRPIERQGAVCRAGTAFHSLYAIYSGFVKCTVTHDDGREQVTGLHMSGELIGMDAINSGKYTCDAVALEECNVCEIDFGELERLGREVPSLQQHFHRIMGREIARDYGVMLLLGSMRAAERIAVFLLNLSRRYAARGCSATRFSLLLDRERIGSYLGIKLETVSRVLSRFQDEGLLTVQHKDIEIKDLERLEQMIGSYRNLHRRAPRPPLRMVRETPIQSSRQYA